MMKSEQKGEDMVDILAHVHKYIPRFRNGYYPVFFDGDQVTRERITGAQDAKLQPDEELRRLRGVNPQSADWHAQVSFYQVKCGYSHA